ncbi:HolB ATPase involved in DNA replication [uncultured Caudovirales phage]|uniref:Sliding-clamp-loader large subunit n=1 Tax=uncultured Caudovirales phage TaxID=2100421 RepID=A0A6J7WZL0_9CAUD|nr:HolB ATPase involved in DNA replication [uncultured Caudovirales phage]
MVRDEFLWVEKYRPKTIEDCVLPDELKSTFQKFVEKGEIPNLLLTGSAGVGKTTVARAMLDQIGADYIVINGSMNGNIDTLRNDILQFASSVSFGGGRKYVILDEADYLNANSTQPALRNFMEEFSRNCGFILTCNFRNRIIEPLHSRCSVVEFKISKADLPRLAAQFFKRVLGILDGNGVKYDKAVVAELIQRHLPDWRRVLNELQRYSVNGTIDTGIFVNLSEDNFKSLVELVKAKNFRDMRKWVGENSDMDSTELFRKFYDSAYTYVKKDSIPDLVLFISRYQYQAAFVADHEINLAAFLTEIMTNVEFN